MTEMVWCRGRLAPADETYLAFDDHGITVGDGIFETIKVTDDGPFQLDAHLRRFAGSAAALSIPMPDDAQVRAAIEAVVATAETPAFLRLTLTAGPGPLGTPRGDLDPSLIVAMRPGAVRTDVTDVTVSPWPRNERGALTGVKSTSYAENVRALVEANAQGATESVFANTVGELCEGTGSNVFCELDGTLVTPPLSSGCLAGITRHLLLEAGIGTEATVTMEQFAATSEAFLVSTAREVQPIGRVDGSPLPHAPGPLTEAARRWWVETFDG